MTSLDTMSPSLSPSAPMAVGRTAPALYAATLFCSALLLFAVQPMFTKLVLPKLGGSPSVWSVAMVAFQGFLFVGYVYAHGLARALPPRRAALVHLGFLALVAWTLPLGLAAGFTAPPSDGVTLWLIGLFAASIGLPFIALSASAPLLQNWFVATGHAQARNPYVLYAASNLGSFCALLAYPFVIEPFLTLQQQIALWSAGFSALVVLIAVAAVFASRGAEVTASSSAGASPGFAQRLSWVTLTAIPAGLSIAVTSYITTDLAAAPFLWIVPLALYLLTFVAVFRDRPWVSHAWALRLVPYVVAPLAVSLLGGAKAHWLAGMLLNLTVFVLIALACHGEAYRRRPDAGRLTEFFLWTSFGGVLGGVFAGLVAPHLFNNIYEYPILIVAALLAMPGMFNADARTSAGIWLREAVPVLLVAAALVWLPLAKQLPMQIVLVAIAAAILLQTKRPVRHVALVVLAFVFTGFGQARLMPVETVRSFFGVHQVVESADGRHRLLYHGTTIHGAELIRDAAGNPVTGRPEPLTYYYPGSPLSDAVMATRVAHGGRLGAVAAVGLGTGSLACYKGNDEHWTFFEIDPEVIRIARDPARFRFLSECAPGLPIITGDARLTLAASAPRYDLVVLDAFSSDAIPVHLLTREAFAGYLSRLAPNGVIAVHVSNQHMELASVVAKVGASEGLVAYFKRDPGADSFVEDLRAKSEVVVLARSAADLGDLPAREGWQRLTPSPDIAAWTDDYANVLAAIWRKKRGD
ncbi:MAG: hypothetical protein JWN71_4166 [Xanthobacteraceae bacterium]|nr:hypothetical protein [Xanthobacteraceae bacterium]